MNLLTRSKALLNQFGENITIFTVEKGEAIKECDFVVVNTRTQQASLPKKESGYFSVGRAIRLIKDENGTNFVICKDGMFNCDNTDEPENRILQNDTGRVCYFEDDQTVSLCNINSTKAGTIIGVMEDGRIVMKVEVNEGGGMQW